MAKRLKDGWQHEINVQKALCERQRRWHALVRRGHAKLSECLEADFGTQKPEGLDIDHWDDDQVIHFKYEKNKDGFLGFVRFDEPENVNLKPLLSKAVKSPYYPGMQLMTNMFSHEVMHCRQGFERKIGVDNSSGSFLSSAVINPEDTAKNPAIKRLEKLSLLSSFNKYKIKDYLAINSEMQARLHEIMSCAYHDWGRIPLNSTELMAGLDAMGLKMPAEIMQEVEASHEGRQAMEDFTLTPLSKSSISFTVGLMNRMHEYRRIGGNSADELRDHYECIYGTMLELYGDTQGRARFIPDLGSSLPHKRILRSIHESPLTITDNDVKKAVNKIPRFYEPETVIALESREETKSIAQNMLHKFKDHGRIHPSYLEDKIKKLPPPPGMG